MDPFTNISSQGCGPPISRRQTERDEYRRTRDAWLQMFSNRGHGMFMDAMHRSLENPEALQDLTESLIVYHRNAHVAPKELAKLAQGTKKNDSC